MLARRHLPTLALSIPHPEPTSSSPYTPQAGTPPTPWMVPRHLVSSPLSSTDSWMEQDEDELEQEWKPEQLSLLSKTLDALPSHLYTPFSGTIPPSNLLDKLARSICDAKGVEWPHTTRQTRVKLVEIARAKKEENATIIEEAGEDEEKHDEDKPVVKPAKPVPLYRQSSMDFLPPKGKDINKLTKLSDRLQRVDRFIPGNHACSRPSPLRSPSSPSEDSYPFPSLTSTCTRSAAVSVRPPMLPQRPQLLRRTASVLLNPLSDMSIASAPTGPSKFSKPPPPKRADSYSAFVAHPTLKRAPSYNAMEVDSPVEDVKDSVSWTAAAAEENANKASRKRARSRSVTASPVLEPPERKKVRWDVDNERQGKLFSLLSSSSMSVSMHTRSSTADESTIPFATKQQTPMAVAPRATCATARSSNMFGPPLTAAQPPTVLPTSVHEPYLPIASETRLITHPLSPSNFDAFKDALSSSDAPTMKHRSPYPVHPAGFPSKALDAATSIFAAVNDMGVEKNSGLLGAAFDFSRA